MWMWLKLKHGALRRYSKTTYRYPRVLYLQYCTTLVLSSSASATNVGTCLALGQAEGVRLRD